MVCIILEVFFSGLSEFNFFFLPVDVAQIVRGCAVDLNDDFDQCASGKDTLCKYCRDEACDGFSSGNSLETMSILTLTTIYFVLKYIF